jgi:hypothetical protein
MTYNTYQGYKPFQKELYSKSDSKAKKVSVEFLESTGWFKLLTPLENQNEKYSYYDYSILHKRENKLIKVEVEQKRVWTVSNGWQPGFGSGIDIPYRKVKSKADLFIMINRYWNTLITIPMSEIKSSKVITKDTTIKATNTKTKAEKFFRVPLDNNKLKLYSLEKGSWKRLLPSKS